MTLLPPPSLEADEDGTVPLKVLADNFPGGQAGSCRDPTSR
jgi:hypothetical protein